MRFKTTLVLTAVFIGLGFYLYFVELRGKEQRKKADEEKGRLFSFSDLDITELTITGPTSTVVLRQVPGHPDTPWIIILPVETVADQGGASSFASQLAALKSTREVGKNLSDLGPFGLDPPAYSVRVVLKGDDSDILEVGGEGVAGRGVYVKLGGTVYLVENGIKSYLGKGLRDWRRQEPFWFFASDVKSFELEKSGQKIEIAQEKEEWYIKSPPSEKGVAQKADASRVFSYLGTLASLRGEEFIDEDKDREIALLGIPFFKLKLALDAVGQEGAFYKLPGDPHFVYLVTTSKAPVYKISLARFEEIDRPVSYFRVDPSPTGANP